MAVKELAQQLASVRRCCAACASPTSPGKTLEHAALGSVQLCWAIRGPLLCSELCAGRSVLCALCWA
eukprot:COSAG02_NODE_43956_length_370_cov_0.745387_1_plen_66_part_10